jgi:pimeloyl-ACP methyl ester carboxylesterase
MKHLFLFSGLGADHRVFQFLDLSGFHVTYIKWLEPLKRETMQQYAARLTAQINVEKPVLVGLSFGGMMAMEVAKHIATEKIVLISSAKTQKEIPLYFRLAGKLKLNKIASLTVAKKPNALAYRMMGAETETEKTLMKAILTDTDPVFFKWAIEKVVTWNNRVLHENVVHIHGKKDLLLPHRFVKADFSIANGTHLMTVQNAKEVSEMLRKIIRPSF